ncbi:uncharacterized protein LOC114290574 [Camellia sinensis]|uniref:uncharacterized protein LOC114290574 n=1 Tax=Camellia sinensis TaxID=4442 RepID=UPI001036C039|nr:uncharacterized protein LOC114290574 [Camellia sinensis]
MLPILTELRHALDMQVALENHVEEGNFFKILREYMDLLLGTVLMIVRKASGVTSEQGLTGLISMHLTETSLWLWTWGVWEKVKYGLMVRALEDIGQRSQLVIAMDMGSMGQGFFA